MAEIKIKINVKDMDALKQALADVEVSPAIQVSMSEAMREWSPMIDAATKAGALGSALDYLRLAHERRMAERSRRIVTEDDLAALGIKRLPSALAAE